MINKTNKNIITSTSSQIKYQTMLRAGSIRVKNPPANSFQRIIANGVVNFNGATRSSNDHTNPRVLSGQHPFRSNYDSSDSDVDSSDCDDDDDDYKMPELHQPYSEEDSDGDDWDYDDDDD